MKMTSTLEFKTIQQRLEQSNIAGHIYQHEQILVLQEPFTENGEALNIFVQHEQTADQLGMQFALKITEQDIEFLIGVTHSNQDRSHEIGTWSLKGEQKAFNLCYAFYNYPKHFYILRYPLNFSEDDALISLGQQLAAHDALDFIHTASKTNEQGEQTAWIKAYVLNLCLTMQKRLHAVSESI